MIKIHIFHTGAVKVDQAIPYKERNPLAVTGFFRSQDKKLILPVSCYLIQQTAAWLIWGFPLRISIMSFSAIWILTIQADFVL